jgi:hypothetical protein
MTHLDQKALTPAQKAVWDVIEKRIEQNPVTGISAEGKPNADVEREQRIFQDGMRVARLAAVNALAALPQAEPVGAVTHLRLDEQAVLHQSLRSSARIVASPTPAVSREDVIEELLAALKPFAGPLNPSYDQVPGSDPYSVYFSVDAIRGAVAAVAAAERVLSQPHSEK